jgi:hypothetical protein
VKQLLADMRAADRKFAVEEHPGDRPMRAVRAPRRHTSASLILRLQVAERATPEWLVRTFPIPRHAPQLLIAAVAAGTQAERLTAVVAANRMAAENTKPAGSSRAWMEGQQAKELTRSAACCCLHCRHSHFLEIASTG